MQVQQVLSSAREIANYCGSIVSVGQAIDPLAQLMSRSAAHLCSRAAPLWDDVIDINEKTRNEVPVLGHKCKWIYGNILDASDSGRAGYSVDSAGNQSNLS